MALHFIRSQHYRETMNEIITSQIAETRRWLLQEGVRLLEQDTLRRTRLRIAGPEGFAARADELLRHWTGAHRSRALFRNTGTINDVSALAGLLPQGAADGLDDVVRRTLGSGGVSSAMGWGSGT
jgi:hypothetical protein